MAIVFDPDKDARNIAERGLSFDLAHHIDWSAARLLIDDRRDYGETRVRVWAPIQGRVYCIVITPRGEDVRIISLRKANRKEIARFGQDDR